MNTYDKIEEGMEGGRGVIAESVVWWLWLIVMVLSFPFVVVVAAVVRVMDAVRKNLDCESRIVIRDHEEGWRSVN